MLQAPIHIIILFFEMEFRPLETNDTQHDHYYILTASGGKGGEFLW